MKSIVNRMLKESTLLKGFEFDDSNMLIKKYRKGQIVSDYIQETAYIGMILEGKIDVYSATNDNKTIILRSLQPFDYFGTYSIFVPKQDSTILCCKEPSTVLLIPKSIIKQRIEDDSSFAMQYANVCNSQIQFLYKRVEELSIQKSSTKLYDYLSSNSDEEGRVYLYKSRDELAEYLGISRATLFREIAKLKKQGKIEVYRNYFTIL